MIRITYPYEYDGRVARFEFKNTREWMYTIQKGNVSLSLSFSLFANVRFSGAIVQREWNRVREKDTSLCTWRIFVRARFENASRIQLLRFP